MRLETGVVKLMFLTLLLLVKVSPVVCAEGFPVRAYDVSGNTLVSQEEINSRVGEFTGAQRNFADIQRALEAIEALYLEKGFTGVLVVLPEQDLEQGVVRMLVRESSIGKITVRGNEHFDESNILSALPALQLGLPPNARRISENIQLANENPSRTLDLVLSVARDPGKLNARVDVKDKSPWRLLFSADNTGNSRTGRDRVGVALQYANLFNRDQVATVAYTTSLEKPDQTRIYSASYRIPLYALGDSVDLVAAYSDVDAGVSTTVAGPMQFSGRGTVLGMKYNWILPRKGGLSHRLTVGLDYRAYDNSCSISGLAVCGAGGADVTIRPLSLTYRGQWDKPGSVTQFSIAAVRNLPGASQGHKRHLVLSRQDAVANYSILKASLSYAKVLAGDWQFRLGFGGQWTRDPLIAAEQFGLSGVGVVRGFEERSLATDRGYFANAEAYTPDLIAGKNLGSLRLLAFYDASSGRFNGRQPGVYENAGAASAGFGFRYAMGDQFSVRADLARVLSSEPSADVDQAGDWRGHIGLSLGF